MNVCVCHEPVVSNSGNIMSSIINVTISIAKAPNQKYTPCIFFLSISQSINARINEPNIEHAKPIPKDAAFPYSLSTNISSPS